MRKQVRKSWFQKQRDAYGQKFLNRINGDDVNKGAIEIIRNLAFRNYDFYLDSLCFLDKTFTSRLLNAAQELYYYKSTLFNCVDYSIKNGVNANSYTLSLRNSLNISVNVYGLVVRYLNIVLQTNNVNYIAELSFKLYDYRHSIREDIRAFPEENPNYKPSMRNDGQKIRNNNGGNNNGKKINYNSKGGLYEKKNSIQN